MKYLILFVILVFNISADKQDLPGELRLLLKEKKPTYVIANAALPYSYDPLEDLNLNNSRIIRMIHARIVESDANGRFSSRVLKSYNYDEAKKTLFFEIKNNVRYTDGSLLTPNDVALAIKRNALLRPNLPGVSKIIGLEDWLKNTHPLLSKFEGVRVDGNRVLVQFKTNLDSPIDKFNACFGVIPEKTVDLKTGYLKEQGLSIPPSAGHYKIVPSKLSDGKAITEPTFVKLQRVTDDKTKPEVVWIVYMSPTNIGKYMKDYHDDVVICAKAVLKFVGGKATNLLIAKDYSLKTIETISENGKEKVTESSSWAPFLSGAAGGLVGGVVGNVIADKMRSKNEPPPQMPTPNSRDLNQAANAPKPAQKNFFQSKDSKQQPHNTKIYKKGSRQAKSGSSGGFFKKKRR